MGPAFEGALGVTFLFHKDAVSAVETQLLDNVDHDNLARNFVHQFQPEYYNHRGLGTCRGIRHMCIP
jgi:hypothetical protein